MSLRSLCFQAWIKYTNSVPNRYKPTGGPGQTAVRVATTVLAVFVDNEAEIASDQLEVTDGRSKSATSFISDLLLQ